VGARVGCSFAALFPQRTASLALIEGGHYRAAADDAADLASCIAEARVETEEDSFPSWDAFFSFQRESLRRWTPALAEAHRVVMREEDGRVVPILGVESLGAIKHGHRLEPVTETYPDIAAAQVPVLLLTAERPGVEDAVQRFRAALPEARVESMPNAVHDLVSFAPREVAALVGRFATNQPPP